MTKLTSHSSYWMDEELFDENDVEVESKEEADLARIARLSAARRAVSNFVNILTGRNDILVEYSSGKQSYTDGTAIVISADDNPDHFDSMVGLALHEGSHILLSDFKYLKEIDELATQLRPSYISYDSSWCGVDVRPIKVDPNVSTYGPTYDNSVTVLQSLFHPALAAMLPRPATTRDELYSAQATNQPEYTEMARRFLDDVRMIMNIIEDRRIDKYVYQTCGGYRPYYDALYTRYFLTAEVERNLKWNPEWRELTVENYINRLLFSIHPSSNRNALPGLSAIIDMMDIRNIDRFQPTSTWKKSYHFDDQPELWKVANTIYAYILRFAALGDLNRQEKNPSDEKTGNGSSGVPSMESILNSTTNLPNLDMGQNTEFTPQPIDNPDKMKNGKDKATTFNAKRGESAVKKAREVAKGEVKKKKVKKHEKSAIDALESAQAKMVDLEGEGIPGGQCMVTRKMNDKILNEDWFLFKRHWHSDRDVELRRKQLAAGKRMGQILVHRLQVRNDPVLTKNTRLQQGGLDRRLLAQLGMDITSVFQKSRIDTFKPAMLHLTLDASGSMHGRKWDKVMIVATALAYVGAKMRNIDTVISIRGGNDIPIVAVVFDSRRDKFTNWMKYAPRIEPNGSTPEGLCFKATMELITECTSTHDVYFINFSDGEPGFHLQNTNFKGKRDRRRSYYYSGMDSSYCSYQGDLAFNHTRMMVQQMRDNGVKVLSYFISDYTPRTGENHHMKTFRRMYGEDATFVNVENAGEVLRTLNKVLLARV